MKTEQQLDLEFEQYCFAIANEWQAKSVGEFTAIKTFKEELYQLCIDKIGSGEQADHFKDLLWKLKKISSGEELNVEGAKQYPIRDLAHNLGIKTRLNVFQCPLHEDSTASAYLYHKTNSWYCFGCQKGGDTIHLVRSVLNLNFVEAVKYLTI